MDGVEALATFLGITKMGVIATKLQESNMAESTSTTTQVVKKDEKSKYKIKVS